MFVIYKYPLNFNSNNSISLAMPEGAEILHVGLQGQQEQACLWAQVDPDAPLEQRKFFLVATGEGSRGNFVEENKYLGTIMPNQGLFVFHVFEQLE